MARNKTIWQIIGIALYGIVVAIFMVNQRLAELQTHSQPEPAPQRQAIPHTPATPDFDFRERQSLVQDDAIQTTAAHNQIQSAQTKYRHGKTALAIQHYQAILQTNPNDVPTHLALAQLYMSTSDLKSSALRHLQTIQASEPNHPKSKIIALWIKQLQQK